MIFSIGHSTRPLDAFVALLQAHGVRQVADVRTVPRSRRYPHFARESLGPALAAHAIMYRHFPGLGGLRHPARDSVNKAWRNDGFRGYADYMATPAFASAVEEFLAFASDSNTALMCAEAVWWRCHRRLIADALVARDMEVRHIVSGSAAAPHLLDPNARVTAGRVTYPGGREVPDKDAGEDAR